MSITEPRCVMKKFFLIIASLLACSCSDKNALPAPIDWKREVASYEEQGWKYRETLGTPGDPYLVGNAESKTARSTSGFWVENGKRNKKDYEQKSEYYCFLAFGKSNGDSFLIVLSKPKPNEPAGQP